MKAWAMRHGCRRREDGVRYWAPRNCFLLSFTRGGGARDDLAVPQPGSPAAGFRSPSGARVTSLCWPTPPPERRRTAQLARRAEGRMPGVKRSNPEKWPGSIRRNYKPCHVEDGGAAPAYTIYVVATPHRIWKLRDGGLRRFALLGFALLWPLLLRAGSALLFGGPSEAVRRGRLGRAAGIAREGDAFSTGQESGRKVRPRLTDSEGRRPGERHRGVLFLFGYFLFEYAKRK